MLYNSSEMKQWIDALIKDTRVMTCVQERVWLVVRVQIGLL